MCNLIEKLSNSIPYIPNPSYEMKKKLHHDALKAMEQICGFYVIRDTSLVSGTGVYVRRSHSKNYDCHSKICVKKGQLLALYPGTLYEGHEAIFFQSIANSFIFKSACGTLIDGNDRGLSRIIFKSCLSRDMCGQYPIADDTWMTDFPINPLNIGQYINNQSTEHPSNVAYQEFICDQYIGNEYRRLIPYLWYGGRADTYESFSKNKAEPLLFMSIVSTRDLEVGEELFSDYFTIIR